MSELKHTIAREKSYGDFLIRFQYVNPNPHDLDSRYEPALVICRPRRVQSRSAWIIMLSSAWKYVDVDSNQRYSMYLTGASHKIAAMLNLGASRETAFRIAEAILDSLEELINMPPMSTPETVVGEAVMEVGGEKITTEVIH